MPASPAHAARCASPRGSTGGRGAVVELHPARHRAQGRAGTLIWRERLADGTEAVIKLYRAAAHLVPLPFEHFRTSNEFRALRQLELLGERCTPPLFWSHGHFGSHGWGELLAMRWLPDCRRSPIPGERSGAAGQLDLARSGRPSVACTTRASTTAPCWPATSSCERRRAPGVHPAGPAAVPSLSLRDPRHAHGPLRPDVPGNTLLRALPADALPPWLAAYGMSDDQQASSWPTAALPQLVAVRRVSDWSSTCAPCWHVSTVAPHPVSPDSWAEGHSASRARPPPLPSSMNPVQRALAVP